MNVIITQHPHLMGSVNKNQAHIIVTPFLTGYKVVKNRFDNNAGEYITADDLADLLENNYA